MKTKIKRKNFQKKIKKKKTKIKKKNFKTKQKINKLAN